MPDEGFSYRFSSAIVRQPGRSVVSGLRSIDRGAPDFERFLAEHRAYVRALEQAGLRVTVLDALEAFPDSVFIEDAALCLPEGVVMLRPGAPAPSTTVPFWMRRSCAIRSPRVRSPAWSQDERPLSTGDP